MKEYLKTANIGKEKINYKEKVIIGTGNLEKKGLDYTAKRKNWR